MSESSSRKLEIESAERLSSGEGVKETYRKISEESGLINGKHSTED